MKIILISLILSLLILPTVLSDVVDITIEYETTTTTPGETTTPTENGGGPGGGGGPPGTTTIEVLTEEILMTYSMPEYFEIYQNETGVFNIEVNNDGLLPLSNIFITISGISGDSYSINPSSISILESGDSSSFSVSVDPQKLTVGTHTLTITITSDEKYETTSLSLNVKSYTREVAEQIEEQEEIEKKEQTRMAWWTLLVTMIIMLAILLSVNVLLTRIKKSPRPPPSGYPDIPVE